MIYFAQDQGSFHIKIGYSTDPAKRVSSMQTANSHNLVLLLELPGTRDDESRLHVAFSMNRVNGEWFEPCAELLNYIAEKKMLVSRETSEQPLQEEYPRWLMPATRETEGKLDKNQIGWTFSLLCPKCACPIVSICQNPQEYKKIDFPNSQINSFSGECGHKWSVLLQVQDNEIFSACALDESSIAMPSEEDMAELA